MKIKTVSTTIHVAANAVCVFGPNGGVTVVASYNREKVLATIPAGAGEVVVMPDEDRTQVFAALEQVIRAMTDVRSNSEGEALRSLKNSLHRFDANLKRFKP